MLRCHPASAQEPSGNRTGNGASVLVSRSWGTTPRTPLGPANGKPAGTLPPHSREVTHAVENANTPRSSRHGIEIDAVCVSRTFRTTQPVRCVMAHNMARADARLENGCEHASLTPRARPVHTVPCTGEPVNRRYEAGSECQSPVNAVQFAAPPRQ